MRPAPPKYIKGVLELNSRLDKVYSEALSFIESYIHLPKEEILALKENKSFFIFILPTEKQPENGFNGFIVIYNYVLRFLKVSIDYASLFPVRNHNSSNSVEKGIKYDEIKRLKNQRHPFVIKITAKTYSEKQPLFDFELCDFSEFCRRKLIDFGNPYSSFNDVGPLNSSVIIPSSLNSRTYNLVGTHFYAPFYNLEDCHCVLFAQNDNPYDENAIKVLRWFPKDRTISIEQIKAYVKLNEELEATRRSIKHQQENIKKSYNDEFTNDDDLRNTYRDIISKRKDKEKIILDKLKEVQLPKDVFFELGHIKRTDNKELHQFMTQNNARILFGKVENRVISLIGGLDVLDKNNWMFPQCLVKIKIR